LLFLRSYFVEGRPDPKPDHSFLNLFKLFSSFVVLLLNPIASLLLNPLFLRNLSTETSESNFFGPFLKYPESELSESYRTSPLSTPPSLSFLQNSSTFFTLEIFSCSPEDDLASRITELLSDDSAREFTTKLCPFLKLESLDSIIRDNAVSSCSGSIFE